MNLKYSFRKKERLCSKKIIDSLFTEGVSFLSFPFKVIYLCHTIPAENGVQVAFSVSKKNFKKAVQRNLLKRRMRESYRLNKHVLRENGNKQLAIFFIYVGKEIVDYKKIDTSMKKVLARLQKELEKE